MAGSEKKEKDSVLREAGTLERIYNANHFSGFYPCFCLSAQYKLTKGLQASPSDWERIIRSAVSSFVLDHGALCSGVVGEDGQHPTFVRSDTLDLAQLVTFSSVDDAEDLACALTQALEDLHSRKWGRLHETPGWKVLLLGPRQETDHVFVIFAAHHAFMDGQGGMVFHRELSKALSYVSNTTAVSVIKVPSTIKLHAPVEELMPVPTTWGFHAQNLWHSICPSWLRNPLSESPWTGNPVTQECISSYRTKTRILRIGASELETILEQCRLQRATLTSLIHAMAVVLLATLVPAHSFLGHTPYTLRNWTGSDPLRDMVNQTSDSSCCYQQHWLSAVRNCNGNREEELPVLWEIARFHRAELTRELSQVPLNNGLATLGRHTDRHRANMRCIGQVRPLTFEVSNLGMVRLEGMDSAITPSTSIQSQPSQDRMAITNLTFTQSAMVNAAALTLSVVSMSDGLAISTSWQPEALDENVVGRFCHGVSEWLTSLGTSAVGITA
ncbi:hypothetical protein BO82DRAFT_397035 [Aspergillus uvarum CBS 121591]|uniref:Alcohol acetyltransferase n=1 Tax=Aspergillus uvarum CBS 121591 TaxID=1448315 RepID=A0A319DG53_9EURO|nr:hypothetical protein BO82DRAFT_397035 [Aspergillus uvarum CBS 121591]PYH87108.1 hypothetical protein BO82DRAFT_397035 [Aspergillus uvarum CBS 121591]